jgi:hypothetical protein
MSIYRNIYSGLGAGSVGGIVAVLVSLPLKSPDDILFNSASVGFTAIGFGAVCGVSWHKSGAERLLNRRYLAASFGLLVAGLAIASAAQTQFDNAVEFAIPLALISVIIPVVGTPIAASSSRTGTWLNGVLVIVAIVLSVALAGQGDQESGSLSLPPPP